MRDQASTEKEILLRELREAEDALAETSAVLGCTCIVDPTETLGDRVRHLGMMAILMQANLGQLRKFQNATKVDRNLDALDRGEVTFGELLDRMNYNREN